MAAVSALSQARRKKPTTYGKSSRNINSWTVAGLDTLDDDETGTSIATTTTTTKLKAGKEPSAAPLKNETKPHTLKTVKARQKKAKDTYDISSSDDEDEGRRLSPIKRISPPKLAGHRKLVSLVKDNETSLAPWEKSKAESSRLGGQKTNMREDPMDQLESELAAAAVDVDMTTVAKETNDEPSPNKETSPKVSSTAARLQARRRLAPTSHPEPSEPTPRAVKHTTQHSDGGDALPRKRIRSAREEVNTMDVEMQDAPTCEVPIPNIEIQPDPDVADIFDVPDSSADESSAAQRTATRPKRGQNRVTRRGKITTYSSPRKMDSAPARLSEMLPDTDTGDALSRSPSVTNSRPSTPLKSGLSSKPRTPETAIKKSGTLTPKQAQLWDQLLPSEAAAPSPSVLPMADLTLNRRRAPKVVKPAMLSRTLAKSSSDVGQRRRTRLVDRLKASAPNTDDEMTDESDESTTGDVNMSDAVSDDPAIQEQASLSQSQSQSQGQSQGSIANSALKVTYGQARSYLPEDNFEDGLMFDISSDPLQRTITSQRTANNTSQKSAFDFDDSDGEEGSGRLRTIHELRAGGGNQRFRDDTSGLLDDIANHNAAARSRRRSALIELATKLADNAFAEKFYRHSYEQQLLAETAAPSDDIADFALATAFATILSGETPAHIPQSLKDGGIFPWLVPFLDVRTDVGKLAKGRRNNMAKAAQKAFLEFATTVAGLETLWSESSPDQITPRNMALNVVDKLVRKLRRAGDRAELLSSSELRAVLPSLEDSDTLETGESFQFILAVSALESLSTTSLSLAWPSDILERIRMLAVSPHLGTGETQHLWFLTLRLCLNLTTENSRNCKALSKETMLPCILKAIGDGFDKLYAEVEESQKKINFDLLVLSISVLSNLAQHSDNAREQAVKDDASPLLGSLVDIFKQGQQRLLEAESVEEANTNVAYGYLAVALANLCRNRGAREIIAPRLPGQNLTALVDAVEEFVVQHQKVDKEAFEGEEGVEVWSAFTEKLKGVLTRLKAEAEVDLM